MNNGGEFVLIGPNGWPVLGLAVIMAVIWWWFAQSDKPPRQRPTFWEAVRWSALKAVFPGVHAWYVSSVSDGDEEEPRVMSREKPQTSADEQTDEPDRPPSTGLSEADQWLDRLEVDRTRIAIIELMVYSGWATGEIRAIIKGDNGAIGAEVEAAKKRLGIADEPRQLRVKDEKGERLIPMEVP